MCDAVNDEFTCVDHVKRKFKCKHCDHVIAGDHLRRRIYHFLPSIADGSVKACRLRSNVSDVQLNAMQAYINKLDETQRQRSEKRKRMNDAVEILTPTSKKYQSTLKVNNSKTPKKEIDLAFARMIIMSICRSGFLDSYFTDHFFQQYFNYSIPSRRTVYRDLLPQLYENTKEQVMKNLNLNDPDSLLTLTMDAWTAPNGDHIRNYCVVTDSGADFMIDAVDVGSASQTSTLIGNACLDVMEKFGCEHFCAVVTDNAANETTSWDVITDAHKDILCTGCAGHAGSLLFKDIFQHQWAEKILNETVMLAKFIKHHTWTNQELKRLTRDEGSQKSIILHAATRFAGAYYTMKRVLEVKSAIKSMVVTDAFEAKQYEKQNEIQRLCQRKGFWDDLTTIVQFLRPLKNLIRLMDHTHHTTHLLYPGLIELGEKWVELKDTVSSNFYRHVHSHYKSRVDFMTFPVHYIAYALSPEHHSDNIWSLTKVMAGTKQILRLYLDSREVNTALEELSDYKDYVSDELFPADNDRAILRPKTWWKVNGSNWPTLQVVALRVFSIGTATAPSERNFSAFSNIWNLRSVNLTSEHAIQLVYVYYNLRSLFKNYVDRHEGIDYGWLTQLNECDWEDD